VAAVAAHVALSDWPLLTISTVNTDGFELNLIVSQVLLTMIVLFSCLWERE
jgi:hypothetical protein